MTTTPTPALPSHTSRVLIIFILLLVLRCLPPSCPTEIGYTFTLAKHTPWTLKSWTTDRELWTQPSTMFLPVYSNYEHQIRTQSNLYTTTVFVNKNFDAMPIWQPPIVQSCSLLWRLSVNHTSPNGIHSANSLIQPLLSILKDSVNHHHPS